MRFRSVGSFLSTLCLPLQRSDEMCGTENPCFKSRLLVHFFIFVGTGTTCYYPAFFAYTFYGPCFMWWLPNVSYHHPHHRQSFVIQSLEIIRMLHPPPLHSHTTRGLVHNTHNSIQIVNLYILSLSFCHY